MFEKGIKVTKRDKKRFTITGLGLNLCVDEMELLASTHERGMHKYSAQR